MYDTLNIYRLHYFAVHFTIGLIILKLYSQFTVFNTLLALSISSVFLASHIYNKIHDRVEDAVVSPEETTFSDSVFIVITIVLLLVPLVFLSANGKQPLFLMCLMPYVFFYSYPIYRGKRIKNILFLKNAVPATFWSGCYSILLYYSFGFLPHYWYVTAITVWMLVFALNVIFDIRDIEGDKAAGVHTIPNVFGFLPAKGTILILLACTYWYLQPYGVSVHMWATLLFLTVATIGIRRQTSPRHYHAIMYGILCINLIHLL